MCVFDASSLFRVLTHTVAAFDSCPPSSLALRLCLFKNLMIRPGEHYKHTAWTSTQKKLSRGRTHTHTHPET